MCHATVGALGLRAVVLACVPSILPDAMGPKPFDCQARIDGQYEQRFAAELLIKFIVALRAGSK